MQVDVYNIAKLVFVYIGLIVYHIHGSSRFFLLFVSFI